MDGRVGHIRDVLVHAALQINGHGTDAERPPGALATVIKPALVALHVGARDVLRLGDALAGRPRGEVPQVERVNVHGVSGVVGQPRRLEVACDGIGPDARRLGCGRGGAPAKWACPRGDLVHRCVRIRGRTALGWGRSSLRVLPNPLAASHVHTVSSRNGEHSTARPRCTRTGRTSRPHWVCLVTRDCASYSFVKNTMLRGFFIG